MDGEEFFATIVTLAVVGILYITLLGGDPSGLINILPEIVLGAFAVAIAIILFNTLS